MPVGSVLPSFACPCKRRMTVSIANDHLKHNFENLGSTLRCSYTCHEAKHGGTPNLLKGILGLESVHYPDFSITSQ